MPTRSFGFTLIETLVYLALFAIIIGGGMVATYQIIQSTESISNKFLVQEEANFLLRKIDWAMSGAANICAPAAGTSGPSLSVTKLSAPDCAVPANVFTFDISGSNLRLQRGAGTPTVLNARSVAVSNISFAHTAASGGQPEGLTASFTINGIAFSTTKYLRK